MKALEEVYRKIYTAYRSGANAEAVTLASSVSDEQLQDLRFLRLCASVFVDCSEPSDRFSIDKGIHLFKRETEWPGLDDLERARAYYNYSNAEGALALHHECNGHMPSRHRAWRRQRSALHQALMLGAGMQSEERANLHTNYGNILSSLGRQVEALAQYKLALKLEPNHPVALSGSGQALLQLQAVQSKHLTRLQAAAAEYFENALVREKSYTMKAGAGGPAYTRKLLDEVKEWTDAHIDGGYKSLRSIPEQLKAAHPDWQPSEPMASWLEHDLLLSVNPFAHTCPHELKDDLHIERVVTAGIDGVSGFDALMHAFNQVKEDFAVARQLYFEALGREQYLVRASAATLYAETIDRAEFGLRPGFLKASLRIAADSLDKIGAFLNLYFELGHDERQTSFDAVWFTNGERGKGVHPTIKPLLDSNSHLAGLFDIQDTWNSYPGPFATIRNRTTHHPLPVYGPIGDLSLDGKLAENIHVDFATLALELLRLVKGAAVCLVGIVQKEEARRDLAGRSPLEVPFPMAIGPSFNDLMDLDS